MTGPPNGEAVEGVVGTPATADSNTNSAAPSLAERLADSKRFNELEARAAKAGHHLTRTERGFVLQKWTYSKHVLTLDDVKTALERMGVRE